MSCSFDSNSAVESGGAFFIKCTDIRTNHSTFKDNSAEEDGGAMFAEDTYDLHFLDCEFDNNIAGSDTPSSSAVHRACSGKSGGSLFVKNSHDIISERSVFVNSVALDNGGAISSVTGNGIIVSLIPV